MVFILDKSGSMCGLESDTIGGFNSLIKQQKEKEGDAYVTTVLFSDKTEMIHDRIPLSEIGEMTDKEYHVGGCTALIDAIGETVTHIEKIHKYIREEDRPDSVFFVITTDGMENASHVFSSSEVKKLISAKKESGWEFIFLGANIDAVETAKSFGIDEDHAAEYACDSVGVRQNFDAVACCLTDVRAKRAPSGAWKEKIKKAK